MRRKGAGFHIRRGLVIVCCTGLKYFNLANQVRVGIVGGMTDILEAQRQAGKVISI